MAGEKWKSPNFEERAGGVSPSMIVLHYTGMKTGEEALQRLCDSASKVSTHYFIGEDGEVIHLVDDDKRAWHAGVSYWDGLSDINSHSIGIEIVNPGHEFGYRAFPDKQIAAVTRLCARLAGEYRIAPYRIVGHSDVAPMRKTDPGELFSWKTLAAEGVGLWSSPVDADFDAAGEILRDRQALHQLFVAYGYNPAVTLEGLIPAFHRHFYPENLEKDADDTTVARLLSLIRAKHSIKT